MIYKSACCIELETIKSPFTFSLFCVAEAVALQSDLKLGYPDVPEMKEYKLKMQQFDEELDQMCSALTDNNCVLEIGSKNPESLLQYMIQQMESECKKNKHVFLSAKQTIVLHVNPSIKVYLLM